MSWERIYDDIDDEIASLVKAGMEDTAPYYQSHDWEELIEEYRSKIRADERKRIVAHLRAVVPYSTNEVERDGLADVIDVIESGEF